ncbi:MAG: hypothetical protein JWP89_2747 [Schlesneria sp.]|nr:hypothetical protein [Schlesneria sp.]
MQIINALSATGVSLWEIATKLQSTVQRIVNRVAAEWWRHWSNIAGLLQ